VTAVKRVSSYRYLGVHITEDLTWTAHIETLVWKQRLSHLRQLRKFRRILQTFYAGVVESILTGSISDWFGNSSSQDRRALQRVVCSGEWTIDTTLPTLQDLYSRRCRSRACRIMKDPHHPNNKLFTVRQVPPQSRCKNKETKIVSFCRPIRTVNTELTRAPSLSLPCTHLYTHMVSTQYMHSHNCTTQLIT